MNRFLSVRPSGVTGLKFKTTLLIWLIGVLKEMHYHEKNLIARGMNECAQILTQTIDYWQVGSFRPQVAFLSVYTLHFGLGWIK